jgi:YegS/Rv2252/BmrU family lipid kinase
MRVLIVYNPTAGQSAASQQEIDIAAHTWREQGWQVSAQPTAHSGDGTELARAAAANGYNLVVAAGGDGTINEVVNGLAGTQTALATLPLGTVNVWARELGLPLQTRAAAEAISKGVVRPIDLGLAGGRYFLLMAGIGFDAAITAQVRPDEKRRLGALAYVLRGVQQVSRLQGTRMRLTLDGRVVSARVLWVVVGNSQLYGGVVKITHRASIDDGLLDVCVIRGDNPYGAPLHLLSILLRRYSLDPEIDYYRARRVEVHSRKRLPVQVDGDAIGQTPMEFEVVPGALRALMPERVGDGLVQGDAATPVRAGRSLQRLVAWLRRRNPHLLER